MLVRLATRSFAGLFLAFALAPGCGRSKHETPAYGAAGLPGESAESGGSAGESTAGGHADSSESRCPHEAPEGGCEPGFSHYRLSLCSPDACWNEGDDRCYASCDRSSLTGDCPACAPACCRVYVTNGGDQLEATDRAVCAEHCLFP
jgi:hypothetical protein